MTTTKRGEMPMAEKIKGTYLTGKLLLAMPHMGDPRFNEAVIFMCANDEKGAMGLVLNHRMADLQFDKVLGHLGITSDIQINLKASDIPVMSGGPVESSRGFMLHSSDFSHDETISINEAFRVTGTVDALQAVASGDGPDKMLFILGYAGWGAGQLEQEIQANAWLVVDPDPDLVFSISADKKWKAAVQKLGFDPAMLSGDAGHA